MRSTIPAAPAYGVYISQTIRYSRSLWLLSGLPVEDISLLLLFFQSLFMAKTTAHAGNIPLFL
jgi:hypothetical protein